MVQIKQVVGDRHLLPQRFPEKRTIVLFVRAIISEFEEKIRKMEERSEREVTALNFNYTSPQSSGRKWVVCDVPRGS